MMGDLYKKNTCLDFPKGGNEALVDALVRGIEKNPGAGKEPPVLLLYVIVGYFHPTCFLVWLKANWQMRVGF